MPVNTIAILCCVGRLDHLRIVHRTAGLNHRGCAGLDRDQEAIGEGEERVGRHHRTFGERSRQLQFFRGVFRLACGNARGIDTAHLPGADADGGAILRIDNGVRFHVLGDAESEPQISKFALRSARAW